VNMMLGAILRTGVRPIRGADFEPPSFFSGLSAPAS